MLSLVRNKKLFYRRRLNASPLQNRDASLATDIANLLFPKFDLH